MILLVEANEAALDDSWKGKEFHFLVRGASKAECRNAILHHLSCDLVAYEWYDTYLDRDFEEYLEEEVHHGSSLFEKLYEELLKEGDADLTDSQQLTALVMEYYNNVEARHKIDWRNET